MILIDLNSFLVAEALVRVCVCGVCVCVCVCVWCGVVCVCVCVPHSMNFAPLSVKAFVWMESFRVHIFKAEVSQLQEVGPLQQAQVQK